MGKGFCPAVPAHGRIKLHIPKRGKIPRRRVDRCTCAGRASREPLPLQSAGKTRPNNAHTAPPSIENSVSITPVCSIPKASRCPGGRMRGYEKTTAPQKNTTTRFITGHHGIIPSQSGEEHHPRILCRIRPQVSLPSLSGIDPLVAAQMPYGTHCTPHRSDALSKSTRKNTTAG